MTSQAWLFPSGIARLDDQVFVAYHDGNHPSVDRLYSIPRCGGEPVLVMDAMPMTMGLAAMGSYLFVPQVPWVSGKGEHQGIWRIASSNWKVSPFFQSYTPGIAISQSQDYLYWIADSTLYRSLSGIGVATPIEVPSVDGFSLTADDTHVYWIDIQNNLMRRAHEGSSDELVAPAFHTRYNDVAHQGTERMFFYDAQGVRALDKKTFAVSTLSSDSDVVGLAWVPQGLLVARMNKVDLLDPVTGEAVRSYSVFPAGNAWAHSITADAKFVYWATNSAIHRFPIEP